MADYFSENKHQCEKEEIKKSVLNKMQIVYTLICPDCGERLQKRYKKEDEYRCSPCGKDVDKPARRINKIFIHKLNKAFFYEFSSLHEEEINAKFAPIQEKADQEYLGFKDVIVLCKRCHMAVTKGYYLCPVCKTNYARFGYHQCHDCFLKTEQSKKYKENRAELIEIEEEDKEFDARMLLFQELEDLCEKNNCSKLTNCKLRGIAISYAYGVLINHHC
jgi:predicted amidophosphoribosyltransferase